MESHINLDIHLTRDDFDVVTENGKLLGEHGEFNRRQFRSMMRGEVSVWLCLSASSSPFPPPCSTKAANSLPFLPLLASTSMLPPSSRMHQPLSKPTSVYFW